MSAFTSPFATLALPETMARFLASPDDRGSDPTLQPGELTAVYSELRNAIGAVLDNTALLERIAGSSYLHDNGFLKLVLARGTGLFAETRLHIWGYPHLRSVTASAGRLCNVHTHSADVVSLILAGELIEFTFAITPSGPHAEGKPFAKFLCGSRAEHPQYTMTAAGSATLYADSERRFRIGQLHGLRHDVLHRVAPAYVPTVTLFLQSSRKAVGTLAYSDSHTPWPAIVQSPPVSIDETREVMRWLMNSNWM